MKIKELFVKPNIFILIPIILVMVFDFVFTLVGQSSSYWKNYNLVNEGDPFARFLLVSHWSYFFIGSFVYLVFIIFLLAKLKRPFNIIIAVAVFTIHVWASSTWLTTIYSKIIGDYTYSTEWCLLIGYFIFLGLITGFFIDKWLKHNKL